MKRFFVAAITFLCLFPAFGQNNRADQEAAKAMELFFNVFQNVNVFYVDSINSQKLVEKAINSMLEELDPYSEYIGGEAMQDFAFQTTGKYAGIGSLIRQRGEWVEIAQPYKDTPSDRAGLKAGDRLLEIDSVVLKSLGSPKVSSMLKGDANTKFKLKVRPIADTNSVREVEITRERISIPSVPYFGMVNDSVGYIQFTSFTDQSAVEVEYAINMLKKNQEFSSLILDLRSNGGGVVDQAIKVVSFFVDANTEVVSMQGKGGQENRVYKTNSPPLAKDIKLAVLINSTSASASEIVAGAVQDLDRGVVVGARSYGKGLVQTSRQVSDKALLKLTIAKYYTPSGRCIQALDYTHRRDDGSVEHVPDSVIREFKTVNGRKVYDGGGINPDVKVDAQYWGKFTAILAAFGFIDDFANLYAAYNNVVPLKSFEVNDQIYDQFVKFMQDKSITYKSASEIALEKLKKEAKSEKYIDRIDSLIIEIESKIKEDKNTALINFKSEIQEAIENAIINRWYYNSGVIEKAISNGDKEIDKAIEILANDKLYYDIVKNQDTTKN